MKKELAQELKALKALVVGIVSRHPDGVPHAEIVRSVLEQGYKHESSLSLSEAVHYILRRLLFRGKIVRNEHEKGVRRYAATHHRAAC